MAVHDEPVIDLIGKDHESVLAGHRRDLQEGIVIVKRAGGIVWVDDDHGLGPGRDLAAHVVKVRHPVR